MKKTLIVIILFCITGIIYSQTELKVLSYNVHHCNPPSERGVINVEAIAKVINESNPDIVALQEIDVHTGRSGKELDQAKELGRLTGMYFFFTKTIDYDGGEYGIAILSKYPFIKTQSFALPMDKDIKGEPRGVSAVIIEPQKNKKIAFACTHLDLKEVHQKKQIDAITEYVKKLDFPVIIAGDFNSKPESIIIQELDKVFQRTCMDNCPYTIPEINPNRTIDYIAFYPKTSFSVIDHQVIDEQYASDHLPVFSILKLK